MRLIRNLVVFAACSWAASGAAAQDVGAAPNYDTVELRSGFSPDPYVVSLQSGGSIDAAGIGSDCRGYISNAPDVRLVYEAGSALPLIISVGSGADTTLVVNAPDGSWHCDDDGGNEGLNPSLRFGRPLSGRYEIWVGTNGRTSHEKAELKISELYSE
jgi:hypothetical protein